MKISKEDICVIGMGRFGNTVVTELIKLRKHVLAMDKEQNNLIKAGRVVDAVVLDATDLEGMKALGIYQFKTVIVAATENTEIVAVLKELKVKHIIAKAKSKSHELVLKKIGVDVIVKPEIEAGKRIALIATNSLYIKYSEKIKKISDNFALGQIQVQNSKWINKELQKLNLFQKLNVSIVYIKRNNKIFIPSGESIIEKNDQITIIGKIENVTQAFDKFN